jgi:hypothetical protein
MFGMKGFNDGFAAVKVDGKWGYMNTEGKMAVPAKYDKCTVMDGGYATVQKDEKWFVVDKNAAEFPIDIPNLDDVNEFSELMASYKTSEGLVGFINGLGKSVIEPKFKAAGDFHGSLAWAKNNQDKVGYINAQGIWIIEPIYDAGKNYDAGTGLARVKKGDFWGYVSAKGDFKQMNDSEAFDDFNSGLAKGKKGGKFGYFNDKMEWVIEPKFDGARDFKNGYASVREGELWGVVDKTGNWVIKPKFEDIKDVEIIR